jgi:hypothetical protein
VVSVRPILAVDVDGVLNAMSRGAPPEGWRDGRALGFRIRYNPGHGAKLLAVAEETGAELVWCTTWEELANEHIAPLVGLPELPWVPMEPGRDAVVSASPDSGQRAGTHYHSLGDTKAAAMCAYASDRPFCWLDDEPDAEDALSSHPVPHLVIQVPERTGLQDEHLERARTWLREHVQPRGGDDG